MTRWLPLDTAATLTTLPPRVLLARAISGSLPAHYLDGQVWIDYPALLAYLQHRYLTRHARRARWALHPSAASPQSLHRLLLVMARHLPIKI